MIGGLGALRGAATTGTSTGAVNSMHDSLTAARRRRSSMFNMMLGEVAPGGVGSGLYGMLMLADRHGVPRRPDGRPHAGVPRQEDRPARDQARRRSTSSTTPVAGARRHGDRDRARPGRGRRCSTPGRTACPRCSTPFTSAANNNGSRVRRAHRRTRRSTTPRSGSACCSAGSCRSCSCSPSPGRWPASSRCPTTAGTLPTHRPLFVGLLVGVALIVVGLTFVPVLALGPIAEGSLMTARHPTRLGAGAARADQLLACTPGAVPQARPARLMWRSPVMFVVEVGAVVHHGAGDRRPGRRSPWPSPSGSGSPCSSPTSPRRSPRAAARRRPPACARAARDRSPAGCRLRRRARSRSPATELRARRPRGRRGRRDHPRRRRRRRGRRLRRRVGHHRRVRAGDPRVRRRPLRRHRRHRVLSDRIVVADHREARARRFVDRMIALVEGAAAAEDAERDRAQHPARRR